MEIERKANNESAMQMQHLVQMQLENQTVCEHPSEIEYLHSQVNTLR